MQENHKTTVVIVGGGTAGWITAGRIAAEHPSIDGDQPVQVVLVESPDIATIGVGEGTWPTMRATLQSLGVSETEFIRECNATFKQGAKFAKWVKAEEEEYYYHPLMIPQGFPRTDLAPYWINDKAQGPEISFSNAVCFQEQLCEQGRAPKLITTPEFGSIANYAYHLDAGKFASFLQKHCCEKLGVKHVLAEVESVISAEDGDIEGVCTDRCGTIKGDLFVDCTGFRSILLGEHYQVPFKDCSDILQIDTALALQVPYESKDTPIACHTISTAQSAGWIWDIGLRERRGIGHVFSGRHISTDEAAHQLKAYIGPQADQLTAREIKIKSGHREHFWHNNCVAVGLSAGFLEPLEASAIVLVELSASMIAEQLPANRSVMDIVAKRFNQTFQYRWERIIDFLKLHYILSKREEPFWQSMCAEESVPLSLRELLELWQFKTPSDADFSSNNEVFPAASYQYVLYGMGFKMDSYSAQRQRRDRQSAEKEFATNQRIIQQALHQMPAHRELIDKIYQHGFQAI